MCPHNSPINFPFATYLDNFIRPQDITVSEPQQQVKEAEDKPQAMTTRETNDTPVRLGRTPRDGTPTSMG